MADYAPPRPQDDRLSQTDKERIIVLLNDRWRGIKLCPISGHNDWVVNDHLVHPPTWHRGAFVLGGPTYPHVLLTCRQCGYSLFFNALIIGFLEPDGLPEQKAAADGDPGTA